MMKGTFMDLIKTIDFYEFTIMDNLLNFSLDSNSILCMLIVF